MTQNTQWYSDETATLGDRLVAARRLAGLTVAQLAVQVGVSQDNIRAWENDQKEPRSNRLQMMTGLFGVSLGWLLTGEGDGPQGETPVAEDLLSGEPFEQLDDTSVEKVRSEIAQMQSTVGELQDSLLQLQSSLEQCVTVDIEDKE